MRHQAPLPREEYVRKKRNRRRLKIGAFVTLVVLLFAGAVFVAHRPNLRISRVELSGGVLVTEAEVEARVLTDIRGSYAYLFPKNNGFLYPHDFLVTDLHRTFPRIDTISISRENPRTLRVEITERKPIGLWCSPVPAHSMVALATSSTTESGGLNSEQCYFMDDQAMIFATAPEFSGDAYFKYYGGTPESARASSTDATPIGQRFVSTPEAFQAINSFVGRTRQLMLDPFYIVMEEGQRFSLVLTNGTVIYLDTYNRSLDEAADNLEALLRSPAFATSSPSRLPVQYIDLRYGNKLFYKFK